MTANPQGIDADARKFGLSGAWTGDELKASYRRLAKTHHPDSNPDDPALHEAFVRLTEAYLRLLEGREKNEPRKGTKPEAPPEAPKVTPEKKAEARRLLERGTRKFAEFMAINEGMAEDLARLRLSALAGDSLVDSDRYRRYLDRMRRAGTEALEAMTAAGKIDASIMEESGGRPDYLRSRLAKCEALAREAGFR